MQKFEFKVVPAPTKAKRGKWVRGVAQRFADRLEQIFNDMAEEGWEYLRTDTLPVEERSGLTQSTTVFRNLLVFRRPILPLVPEMPAPQQIEDSVDKPVALIEGPTGFKHPTEPEPVPTPTGAAIDNDIIPADPKISFSSKKLFETPPLEGLSSALLARVKKKPVPPSDDASQTDGIAETDPVESDTVDDAPKDTSVDQDTSVHTDDQSVSKDTSPIETDDPKPQTTDVETDTVAKDTPKD